MPKRRTNPSQLVRVSAHHDKTKRLLAVSLRIDTKTWSAQMAEDEMWLADIDCEQTMTAPPFLNEPTRVRIIAKVYAKFSERELRELREREALQLLANRAQDHPMRRDRIT